MTIDTPHPLDPSRRLMLMVGVLHDRGYQRLRINPGLAPSGMYWRCTVYPVDEEGQWSRHPDLDGSSAASYSSGAGTQFFGWEDAAEAPPEVLADKFLERFPVLARLGWGEAPAYARWYAEMLDATAPLGVIYGFADFPIPGPGMGTWNVPKGTVVPWPPKGNDD